MLGWLLNLPIQADGVLVPVYAVAAVLVTVLLIPVPGVRARLHRWWPAAIAAAGLGALAGSLAVWIVVDLQDLFGAPASPVIRGAAAAAGAGIGLAVVNLVRVRWWRRAVAVLVIPVVAVAGGLIINRDVAYYPKLGDALGLNGAAPLAIGGGNRSDISLSAWTPPAGMPASGIVGTVEIPGRESHWRGRTAWVYEPPAARVAHPPRLPVIVAFSGQPGGPSDVFQAGGLAATMDAVARRHRGVAPIVVVPDQLGAYNVNPECVDSPMGNVATYVTRDVRAWILRNLSVSANRRDWAVAGFSQGATCAVQFGTGYPALFSSFIAVSPELGPINGTVARSLREAFHGSLAAWKAAQPIEIMLRKRPYRDSAAALAVGALDHRYDKAALQLEAAARQAGMTTWFTRLPGVSHNWNTGAAGLRWGIGRLETWWGLP